MKEKEFEKLFIGAKEITLSNETKNSARENILAFIKANPLPVKKFLNFKYILIPAGSFAAIFLLGFIVSAKADSALPGDTLYPVKLGKEQVLQVMAANKQTKLKLNIEFAEKRLEEAEKLTVLKKIDSAGQAEISKNFEQKAIEIKSRIKELNVSKNFNEASKVASDFEATLEAHSRVMEVLKENNSENTLQPLIKNLEEKAKEMSEARKEQILNISENIKKEHAIRQEELKKRIEEKVLKNLIKIRNKK